MRLTKKEKQALFELLDVMTDKCPQQGVDRLSTPINVTIYWKIFTKLRLELRGF